MNRFRGMYIAVLLALVVGCGGGDGNDEQTPPPLIPSVTPTDSTATAPKDSTANNPADTTTTNPSTPSDPTTTPSGRQRSPEAQRLLNYLNAIYGQKTLSGTMANVNWNINEATWVHKHTGKWPALNCFDYIHLPFSQSGGWIDYSNISVVEQWHNAGGIVAIMWHWNVPANNGTDYSFYYGSQSDQTRFDVSKVFNSNTDEYRRMVRDIDQVAVYLKLLKDKGIPVIWRPLHEAGGRWFWWGMNAAACRQLWKLMFQRFDAAGLDNLIWTFTPAAAWNEPYEKGFDYYPGDDYVDIVGMDVYNVSNPDDCYTLNYKFLQTKSPSKPAALTECGNVATISSQWNAGARWLFFMPWYDYDRTNNVSSTAFNSTAHGNASVSWWKDAFNCDYVLTRDRVNY